VGGRKDRLHGLPFIMLEHHPSLRSESGKEMLEEALTEVVDRFLYLG